MENFVFIMVLALFFIIVFRWAFRTLPNENWQFIASVPLVKDPSGSWNGRNYTYYGFLQATGAISGISMMLVLMGAISVPVSMTAAIVALMVIVCVPASKIVAMIVEKKKGTFTVGGATFVGMLTAPLVVWATNRTIGTAIDFDLPLLPVFAAIGIGYALGEGIGRLACLSFGCCYGKALSECSPLTQRILAPYCLVFSGKTKKITYESGLNGKGVVPIQAMTSIIYVGTSLLSAFLFLHAYYESAFLLSLLITQVWRVWSETLRADFRGEGKISAYQIMAIISVALVIAFAYFLGGGTSLKPNILAGLKALWDPAVILFLQAVGLIVFLYLGKSTVTKSTISFDVAQDQI